MAAVNRMAFRIKMDQGHLRFSLVLFIGGDFSYQMHTYINKYSTYTMVLHLFPCRLVEDKVSTFDPDSYVFRFAH